MGATIVQGEEGPYAALFDHGFVSLVERSPWRGEDDLTAMDLSVANCARISFMARSGELGAPERGLIRSLMRDHHGTPFEHQTFTFWVRAPIFVFREWHRHRTASISEASARYKPVPNLFYVPDAVDMRVQVGKANAYTFEPMDPLEADRWRMLMRAQNENAFALYERMLDADPPVAKEVARTVLPVSMYSEMLWTVNARNLMGFLALRNAAPAQREIRMYAEAMEAMFARVMPVTAAAFVEFGRVKP